MKKGVKIILVVIVLAAVAAGLVYLYEPNLLKPSHWSRKEKFRDRPADWTINPAGKKLIYTFEYETSGYKMPGVVQGQIAGLSSRLSRFAAYPANLYAEGMKVKGSVILRPNGKAPEIVVEGTVYPRSGRSGYQVQGFTFTTSLEYSELFGTSYRGPKPYVVDVGAQLPCGLDIDFTELALMPHRLPNEGETVPMGVQGGSSTGQFKFMGKGTKKAMGRECCKLEINHRITGQRAGPSGPLATYIDVDGILLLSEKDGIIVSLECDSCRAVTERWPGSGLGILLEHEYDLKLELKSVEGIGLNTEE